MDYFRTASIKIFIIVVILGTIGSVPAMEVKQDEKLPQELVEHMTQMFSADGPREIYKILSLSHVCREKLLPNVHKLDFSTLPINIRKNLTKERLSWILQRLPNLQELNFCCTPITNDELIEITSKYNNLQSLDLSGCYQITSEGLRYIAKHCRQIQFLSLQNCTNIKNAGLKTLLTCCPKLKELDLMACGITDAGFELIAAPHNQLKRLDVANCNQITDSGLKLIVKQYPYLQQVIIANNTITNTGLTYLAQLQYLEELCFCGCKLAMKEFRASHPYVGIEKYI